MLNTQKCDVWRGRCHSVSHCEARHTATAAPLVLFSCHCWF